MSSMKRWIKLCAVMSTLGASSPAADKTLIDYFLPAPIRGQLTTDVWGAPNVLPRDPQNGLEDSTMKQWCYWDGEIVKGPDVSIICLPVAGIKAGAIVDGLARPPCTRSATSPSGLT